MLFKIISGFLGNWGFIFIPTIFAEELSSINPKIKLIYNHGSFSEMDYETVEFYLKTFLTNDVKYLFEINSNESATNAGAILKLNLPYFLYQVLTNY